MPAKGQHLTPEQLARHIAIRKGKPGHPISEETKAKISAANKGRKRTATQNAHQSAIRTGIPNGRKGTWRMPEQAKDRLRDARSRQVHPSLAARGLTFDDVRNATNSGMRWCPGECKSFISRDRFYNNGNSKTPLCRDCSRSLNKKIYNDLSEEEKRLRAEENREYRRNNPEKIRRADLLAHYGVTPEWYDEALAAQGGHCALCESTVDERKPHKNSLSGESRKYLVVDHDHESGEVRGLLCAKCNTALCRVEYVTDWAMKAIEYLRKHGSFQKVSHRVPTATEQFTAQKTMETPNGNTMLVMSEGSSRQAIRAAMAVVDELADREISHA